MQEEFGITAAGIRSILRKTFNRVFPILLVAALGGMTIPIMRAVKDGQKDSLNVLDLIPLLIVAVFMTIAIFRTKSRLEKIYRDYKLVFEADSITRTAPGMPAITIPFHEIKQVKRTAMGGFAIVGSSRLNTLFIPAQLENIDRVEELLKAIPSVTITEQYTLLEKLGMPIVLSMLILFGFFVLSDHPAIILSTGIILSGGMTWSFFMVQKSKMYDQASKYRSWLTLLVALAILTFAYLRVFYW